MIDEMCSRLALCAVTLAACGRVGFDSVPDAQAFAPGAPAFVQVALASCGSASTCSAVFPAPVAAGDFVVVTATYDGGTVSAVADTPSDAFSPLFTDVAWPVQPFATSMWTGATAGSSAFAVVVQFSSPFVFADVYAQELANVSAVDQSATAGGATGIAVEAGPVVTTAARELVFGHGEAQNAVVELGNGFTEIDDAVGNIEEYELAPTAGSYGASFGLSSPAEWIAFVVTLR
jgi:hypothetical protein